MGSGGGPGKPAIVHRHQLNVRGPPPVVPGQQPLVRGQPAMVHGQQAFVRGHQPMVPGQQPFVRGRQAFVRGQQPLVHGPQPNVRGHQPHPLHPNKEGNMSKRYPRTESEFAALALRGAEGLAQHPEDFPNPPVSAADLKAKWEVFNAADTATVAAKDAYLGQHAVKDDAFEDMEDATKADLRYAEVAVRDRPEKLTALGWRPRRDGSPLEPPGETRDISIVSEGDTWVILRWNPPVDGGAPGFYRIQRKREGSPWEDAATSTETEHLVSNQPRGVDLLYRVIAVNKAGAGQPSATVTVVL